MAERIVQIAVVSESEEVDTVLGLSDKGIVYINSGPGWVVYIPGLARQREEEGSKRGKSKRGNR